MGALSTWRMPTIRHPGASMWWVSTRARYFLTAGSRMGWLPTLCRPRPVMSLTNAGTAPAALPVSSAQPAAGRALACSAALKEARRRPEPRSAARRGTARTFHGVAEAPRVGQQPAGLLDGLFRVQAVQVAVHSHGPVRVPGPSSSRVQGGAVLGGTAAPPADAVCAKECQGQPPATHALAAQQQRVLHPGAAETLTGQAAVCAHGHHDLVARLGGGVRGQPALLLCLRTSTRSWHPGWLCSEVQGVPRRPAVRAACCTGLIHACPDCGPARHTKSRICASRIPGCCWAGRLLCTRSRGVRGPALVNLPIAGCPSLRYAAQSHPMRSLLAPAMPAQPVRPSMPFKHP